MSSDDHSRPITLMLADDDAVLRTVLLEVLAEDENIHVVGVGEDADQAIELAVRTHPDVALLDVIMPGGGGPRACRQIRRGSPTTHIVALSANGDEHSITEMLSEGAGGYLLKTAGVGEILDSIHRAAEGRMVVSDEVAATLLVTLQSRLEKERSNDRDAAQWRERLERVLSDGLQLTMNYQPIFDLKSGELSGVEALARFASDPRMTPDRWFAAAWASGLGEAMELLAVSEATEILDQLPGGAYLSLNLSPRADLLRAFGEFAQDLPLDRMVVEITEHAPVADYPGVRAAMEQLRLRGVRFAIDDTGAGYASLRHILQLHPDFLKLDISLTHGIDTARSQRAITAALVAFAEETSCSVIAEGIETKAEEDTLRELGVGYGQGFLLGYPGPLADLVDRRLTRK